MTDIKSKLDVLAWLVIDLLKFWKLPLLFWYIYLFVRVFKVG